MPVYKDVSMDDANWNSQLRSTYMDLGKWGPGTFRHSVPHVVKKREANISQKFSVSWLFL